MNPQGLRVLHFEDSPDYSALIGSFLHKEGMTYRNAPTLAKGLEEIQKEAPDVVLLDLQLIDAQGIDVINAVVQSLPESVPILPLTSSEDEARARSFLSQGAQDYLMKDQMTQKSLARVILYSIERKKHESEVATLREKIARGEKMSTLGTLVAGIAHELNNPLAVVQGYAEMLLAEDFPPQHKEKLEAIHAEATRCGALIRQLMDFSRGRDMKKEAVDLNALLTRLVKLMSGRLESHRLVFKGDPVMGGVSIQADPNQLLDVFTRIVDNAILAVKDEIDPKIVMSTRLVAPKAVIRIEDNGPGVDAEKLPRLFDPFFSTKDVGKGMGMGLFIAFGIISRHGGSIRAENIRPQGLAIVVELPVGTPAV